MEVLILFTNVQNSRVSYQLSANQVSVDHPWPIKVQLMHLFYAGARQLYNGLGQLIGCPKYFCHVLKNRTETVYSI